MWSSVLVTDLLGTQLGEIPNQYDRRLSFRLRRMATQTFSVRLDDPMADVLLEQRALAKTYEGTGQDDWSVRFVGDVISAEEKGTEQTKRVEVTCADAFWRLGHRLIGKSTTGFVTDGGDRGTLALGILAGANQECDTGIRPGAFSPSSDTGKMTGWYYKPASEAINELAAPLDGFDWIIDPVEPILDGAGFPNPVPVIGNLNVEAFIGTRRDEAIFEYGCGRTNVRDYSRAVTKDGLANAVYTLPPGFPQSAMQAFDAPVGAPFVPTVTVATAQDGPSIATWGRFETVVASDLASEDLRTQLVQAHLAVRKQPRQIVTFSPVREDVDQQVPRFKADYDLGDFVTFRAVNRDRYEALILGGTPPDQAQADSTRIDAVLRVYGVDVAIDTEGQEQMTLTLVEEGGG